MRQFNDLNRSIEIEEEVVAGVVCAVAWIDNRIGLVGSGKTIGGIQLVHCPPGSQPTPSQPEEQRYDHANTEDQQPMHSSFGRWLAMDNHSPVPLLDNLVAPGVNIPPGTGWHTRLFLWKVQRVSQVERVIWIVLARQIRRV